MAVTLEAVNALPHEREIKALFLAHQRPEFADFFDRTYPAAVANGATSWIGRDEDGRVVMHIACFPRRYALGARALTGGLMVNLMVTEGLRSFFPALSLLQRLIRDTRATGKVDFLYADPNDESRALLRGTRFVRFGTLRRYVLPVGDGRAPVDLTMRLLQGLRRLTRVPAPPLHASVHSAAAFASARFEVPDSGSQRVVAHHEPALYRSRLAGYPAATDWWLCGRRAGAGPAGGALLVRGPDRQGLAVLHAVRLAPDIRFAWLVPSLVTELRRRGCRRLQVSTIAESNRAAAFRRAGFLPRPERLPLFALPLTPQGGECLRAVRDWEITDLECDR